MEARKINVDVNQFPTLTYNWLNINRTHLNAEVGGECEPAALKTPEGISLKKEEPSLFYSDDGNTKDLSDKNLQELLQKQTGLGKPFDTQFNEIVLENKISVSKYVVPKDKKISEPVRLSFSPKDKTTSACDQIIYAEKNSESTFIMNYSNAENSTGLFGVRTRIYAEENAVVHIVKVNLLGKDFTHFDSIGSVLGDNAKVEVTQIELGAKSNYTGTYNCLEGRKSSCLGHVGYVATENQTLDINYVAHQTGKETSSQMNVNGVLDKKAQKVWRGTIDFVKGAKNSTGDEKEEVLLLSPEVVNKTLPVILCDEEDVEGHHGASIGRLDSDILFYMQTRGIDEKTAQEIMIKSKIYAVCRFIPDETLVQKIQNYIEGMFVR